MSDTTTTSDVVLDTVAALDLYVGLYGSGETTIEDVSAEYTDTGGTKDSLVVKLDDGSEYRLTVEAIIRVEDLGDGVTKISLFPKD